MPDIFDEVEEDLRAERARRLFSRYGILLGGVLVLAVAGVGGWEAWKAYAARHDATIAGTYIAATRAADGPEAGRAAAVPDLAKAAADGGAGYRTLARLREAALKADSGDLAGGLALWDQVASDGGADPLLRDLASLQWAAHQIDGGNAGAVEQRLKPLASPDNPWHALAQEAQAMLALKQGHADAARDTLKQLSQDMTAPDGVRGRANGLLARLGVEGAGTQAPGSPGSGVQGSGG